jgi:PGF-pre-PGF domain-containing protein
VKLHELKLLIKYGLFLMFIMNLVSNANADTNQLVCYNWSADMGDTIVDNSGHENNGMNNGSTTFLLPTGHLARHFNGQNRITITNNEQLAFTDPHVTFGLFFRYDNGNPTHYTYLISKGNNTFRLGIDQTNLLLNFQIYADGHTLSGSSASRIQPGKDYEAIVTYDGSHAQLYMNGIANGKGVDYTAAALGPSDNAHNWTIGSPSDATSGLNGAIYSFYLYNRTLNSSEILDLYGNDLHSVKKLTKPGGIALSWDDTAHIDPCFQYLSLFHKYNATCTININKIYNRQIPTQTLVNELNALQWAGWEIAGHGYNHNNSVDFLNNNTATNWLDQEIFPNIVEATRYGYPMCTLAYPYSARNTATDAAIAPYFRTLRTRAPNLVNGNVNETTLAYYNWDDSQLLYGVEIDDWSGASLQSIEDGIDYAIKTGSVLVIYGHQITPEVTISYETSTSRLESILRYTSQNGGVFYHMRDLGNSAWKPLPRFSKVTSYYIVSTDSLMPGKNVTFVDYSVNQTSEVLDFGDGSPKSSTANVTHTYMTPGIYTANLTVTNEVSTDSMLKKIMVIQPAIPVASFTSNTTTGFRPLSVAFTDTSTGFPTSWSWDFGDGVTSTSRNPVHEYSNIGNYSVALTVENDKGSDKAQKANYITVLLPLTTLPQLPSANFSSNLTFGKIPLTVQFNDTSTGFPTSWNWDFGDGNASVEQSPMHTYFSAGTYNINLTVNNINGTDSKIASITVQGQTLSGDDSNGENSGSSSGSSNSGSSSSGVGGGSPEPQSNVEVKEISQGFITSGECVKFDFPLNVTSVVYISFDSKKTTGKTKTIVEMLKGKSVLVTGLPSDEIYKHLNIWVGNSGFSNSKNIEKATICFKVEKSWLKDKKIDESSITLNRYNGTKWTCLQTNLLSEDDKYIYFTAETPGFSPFAITGKTTTSRTIQPTVGGKTQPLSVNGTQIKTGAESTAASNEQSPNKKQNSNISGKGTKNTPGFEAICGIISLLAVFLHMGRKKRY